jgi:hypothetical protein
MIFNWIKQLFVFNRCDTFENYIRHEYKTEYQYAKENGFKLDHKWIDDHAKK